MRCIIFPVAGLAPRRPAGAGRRKAGRGRDALRLAQQTRAAEHGAKTAGNRMHLSSIDLATTPPTLAIPPAFNAAYDLLERNLAA